MMLPELVLAVLLHAQDSAAWPRFRGPNGTGVASATTSLPAEFGPSKNVVWKVPVGTGHSSPVLWNDRLYLTALEGDTLVTLCFQQADGKLLWKREAPRPRREPFDKRNNAASPSPAAAREGIYIFFPEFGLLSYTHDGKERWSLPLGPFDNLYGMGASPVVAGDLVVLVVDQSRSSYILAASTRDGRLKWKTARPEAVSGHSTPVLYQPKGGPLQIIAPGSFRMDAYQASTGESVWHATGLASEMKSVPVVDGDVIYINGYNLPENDPGRQVPVPEFATQDTNADGAIVKEELTFARAKSFFEYLDLDRNQKLDQEEWRLFVASMAAENGLLAIRPGGKLVWKFGRSIPQLPSTLVYQGILYMINDGGILTTLDPATGTLHAQQRLRTVTDRIYASPVAAAGYVFFSTEAGQVVVRKAGVPHEIAAVNELGEGVYATPAVGRNRLFVRTVGTLWCFGGN